MEHKTAYKAIKSYINRNQKEAALNRLSSMSYIVKGSDDKPEIISYASYACYGWTGRGYGSPANKYVATYIHNPELTKKEEQLFLEWLKQESPWKDGICNSVTDILKGRIVLGNVTIPNNVMYAALFSARMLTERPATIRFWCELVKGGVPGNVAFLLCHCVGLRSDGTTLPHEGFEVNITPGVYSTSDHMPLYIPGMRSPEFIRNYLSGTIVRTSPTFLDTGWNGIRDVQRMFTPNDSSTGEEDHINTMLETFFTPPKDKSKKSNNPFLKDSDAPTWGSAINWEKALSIFTNNWPVMIEGMTND